MGVYMLAFFGIMPVGALLGRGLATALGAPLTVAISAVGFLGCAIAIAVAVP